MAIEPVSLVLIIVTMIATIAHIIIDMFKYRSAEKIDKSKLQLDQQKVGLEMMMTFFPQMKDLVDFDLKKPEELKNKIDELKDLVEKYKELGLIKDKNQEEK